MKNIKVMVNWEKRKITHTQAYKGSAVYEGLIAKGYVPVGVVKHPEAPIGMIINPSKPEFFWQDEYYDADAKYIALKLAEQKARFEGYLISKNIPI